MNPEDQSFAKAAKAGRLLTTEQLEDCIETQKKAIEIGLESSLKEVVIKKGFLDEGEADRVEKAAAKDEEELIATIAESPTSGKPQPIEGFELKEILGKGSFGVVYKALQVGLGREVAVKILPPRLAENEEYRLRFFREARTAAKLDHPNVVRVLDVGKSEEYFYYVMEYISGQSLDNVVKERGVLSEEKVVYVGRSIAQALDAADKLNLIHRDIKPANLLVTNDGRVKLADFGIARETGQTAITQEGHTVGTPNYVSPEQARAKSDIDIRSDIYSLGATLYHLAAGRVPFEGSNAMDIILRHAHELADPPHEVNPEISEELSEIILLMMNKEPEHRFQHPFEIVDALDELEAVGAAELEESSLGTKTRAKPRQESSMVFGALVSALVGVLLVYGTVEIVLPILKNFRVDDEAAPRYLTDRQKKNDQVNTVKQGGEDETFGQAIDKTDTAEVAPSVPSQLQERMLTSEEEEWLVINDVIRTYPEDIQNALMLLEGYREKAKRASLEDELRQLTDELKKKVDLAAAREFSKAQATAAAFLEQKEYGKAMNAYWRFPHRSMTAKWMARLTTQAEQILSLARSQWNEKRKLARQLVASGNLEDAQALLSSIQDIGIPELDQESLAEMRLLVEMDRSRKVTARKEALGKFKDVFRLARLQCGRFKFDEAEQILAKALNNPDYRPYRSEIAAERKDIKLASEVLTTALKGAEKAQGVSVRFRKTLKGIIYGVQEGKVLIKAGGATMALPIKIIEITDIIRLADRAGDTTDANYQLGVGIFLMRLKQNRGARNRLMTAAGEALPVERYLDELDGADPFSSIEASLDSGGEADTTTTNKPTKDIREVFGGNVSVRVSGDHMFQYDFSDEHQLKDFLQPFERDGKELVAAAGQDLTMIHRVPFRGKITVEVVLSEVKALAVFLGIRSSGNLSRAHALKAYLAPESNSFVCAFSTVGLKGVFFQEIMPDWLLKGTNKVQLQRDGISLDLVHNGRLRMRRTDTEYARPIDGNVAVSNCGQSLRLQSLTIIGDVDKDWLTDKLKGD